MAHRFWGSLLLLMLPPLRALTAPSDTAMTTGAQAGDPHELDGRISTMNSQVSSLDGQIAQLNSQISAYRNSKSPGNDSLASRAQAQRDQLQMQRNNLQQQAGSLQVIRNTARPRPLPHPTH